VAPWTVMRPTPVHPFSFFPLASHPPSLLQIPPHWSWLGPLKTGTDNPSMLVCDRTLDGGGERKLVGGEAGSFISNDSFTGNRRLRTKDHKMQLIGQSSRPTGI